MKVTDFKSKPSGHPILKQKDIEDFAENILHLFKPDLLIKPQEVSIELLIEAYLGLDVDYKNLSVDKTTLGLTTFGDGYIIVFDEENREEYLTVNAGTIIADNQLLEGNPGRLRFTYAHEASHWVLHRHLYLSDPNQMLLFQEAQEARNIKCLNRNVEKIFASIGNTISTDEDWLEWQADSLGACLLLPKHTFILAFKQKLQSYGINQLPLDLTGKGGDIYYLIVEELSQIFNVSKQAVQVRLSKLKLVQRNTQQISF
ncbi:hypothetical protein JCM17380_16310 [Desulfosporosinus burensis]